MSKNERYSSVPAMLRGMGQPDLADEVEDTIHRRRFGRRFGILFWNYNLSVGSRFITKCGHHLRAFGLVIPWTNCGIFIVRRSTKSEYE